MAATAGSTTFKVDLDNEGLLRAAKKTEEAGLGIAKGMSDTDRVLLAMTESTNATVAAINKLNKGLNKTPASTKKAKEGVDELEKSLSDMDVRLSGLGRRVSGGLGASLSSLGSKFTFTAGDIVNGVQAISAAIFDLAGAGAQLDTLQGAFKELGGTSKEMDDLREATKGLITDKALIQMSNQAKLFKISGDSFKSYAKIAVGASLATGESVEKMLGDVLTAVSRQSTEIADNFGVVIKISEVNEAAAKKANKSLQELTATEKKLAFEQALVAASGQQMALADTVRAGGMAGLTTNIENAKDQLGLLLNKVLVGSGIFDTLIGAVDLISQTFQENEQVISHLVSAGFSVLVLWVKAAAAQVVNLVPLLSGFIPIFASIFAVIASISPVLGFLIRGLGLLTTTVLTALASGVRFLLEAFAALTQAAGFDVPDGVQRGIDGLESMEVAMAAAQKAAKTMTVSFDAAAESAKHVGGSAKEAAKVTLNTFSEIEARLNKIGWGGSKEDTETLVDRIHEYEATIRSLKGVAGEEKALADTTDELARAYTNLERVQLKERLSKADYAGDINAIEARLGAINKTWATEEEVGSLRIKLARLHADEVTDFMVRLDEQKNGVDSFAENILAQTKSVKDSADRQAASYALLEKSISATEKSIIALGNANAITEEQQRNALSSLYNFAEDQAGKLEGLADQTEKKKTKRRRKSSKSRRQLLRETEEAVTLRLLSEEDRRLANSAASFTKQLDMLKEGTTLRNDLLILKEQEALDIVKEFGQKRLDAKQKEQDDLTAQLTQIATGSEDFMERAMAPFLAINEERLRVTELAEQNEFDVKEASAERLKKLNDDVGASFLGMMNGVLDGSTSTREKAFNVIGEMGGELGNMFLQWGIAESALLSGIPGAGIVAAIAMKAAGGVISSFGGRGSGGGGGSPTPSISSLAARASERESDGTGEKGATVINYNYGYVAPDETATTVPRAAERGRDLRGRSAA